MPPATAPRTKRATTPFKLTPTDEELLETCARYQYVTVAQWCRFFEDPNKARYLQRRCLKLAEQNYLIRLYLTPSSGRGKGPNIFTLGPAGRAYVQSLGKRVVQRFRPIDI